MIWWWQKPQPTQRNYIWRDTFPSSITKPGAIGHRRDQKVTGKDPRPSLLSGDSRCPSDLPRDTTPTATQQLLPQSIKQGSKKFLCFAENGKCYRRWTFPDYKFYAPLWHHFQKHTVNKRELFLLWDVNIKKQQFFNNSHNYECYFMKS